MIEILPFRHGDEHLATLHAILPEKKLGSVTVSNASEAVKEIFEPHGFDQTVTAE